MPKRKSPPYLLTVLTGPNAGAELGLSGARKSLGANTKQDIQLDGLPAEALRFMMERNQLVVKPARDVKVAIRGGEIVKAGRSTTLSLPVQLTIDEDVTLHLCRLQERKGFFARQVPVLAAAACTIAVLGFGFSTLLSTSGLATASALPTSAIPTVASSPVATEPEREPISCGSACMEQAADAFRALLDEAGLDGVTVVPETDILRVTTQGIAQGDPRWSSVRHKYDQAWASRAPLLVERAKPITKAPFAVQSVWLGTPAEVTTREGQVYRVGSLVPGGWTIEAIRSGSVDLIQGRDRIRIEF